MKKLFLLILSGMAMLANADTTTTTYEGTLNVTLGTETTSSTNSITIEKQTDGNYTLSLKNFIYENSETEIPIGNIVVTDVEGTTQDDGSIKLEKSTSISITAGDDKSVSMWWYGPTLGEVPIELEATMTSASLECKISINMTVMGVETTITVEFNSTSSGINLPTVGQDATSGTYNISGQQVNGNCGKGIVIRNGKKYVTK